MKKLLAGNIVGLILMLGMATGVQAQGDADAGQSKANVCVACHGESGNDSALPNVPKIGGQNEKYLLKQLVDIKEGVRVVPEMVGILEPFDAEDLADMAAYYSSQEEPLGAAVPELVDLGEQVYRAGVPEVGVAACTACHSPTGSGNEPAGYPALNGQDPTYTAKQLRDFRTGTRANDESGIMRAVTDRMSDEEIEAVASYVSGLR